MNVLFDSNEAAGDGGAVAARQSIVWFSQSTFIDNVAPSAGSAAAIYEVVSRTLMYSFVVICRLRFL